MSKIEAHEETLKSYLQIENGSLFIPYSQRPYEWTEKQVKRLFEDLIILNNSNVEIHMLNFFTLSKENDNLSIFDGQQRTITTILFIGAIANIAKKEGFTKLGKEIVETYIKKTGSELEGNNDKLKILFDSNHKESESFLYSIIEDPNYTIDIDSIDSGSKNTVQSIEKNYHLLEKLIDDYLKDSNFNTLEDNSKKKFIISLFNDILTKTQLITIITENDSLAMAMFETLNNTGKQLENFFVLKNDIISTTDVEPIKELWENIEVSLDSINYNQFLTTFATILLGKVSKDNLLNKLYSIFPKKDVQKMKELLKLMDEGSINYRYICIPDTMYNNKKYTNTYEIEKFIKYSRAIDLFHIRQHFPILLAMFMHPSQYLLEDIIKVQKSILALTISKFYFCSEKANKIEKSFANLAHKIYTDKINTLEILENIKIEFPILNLLKNNIENFEVRRQNHKIKFLLRETYNHKYNKETVIKEDTKNIHYEHILPQTISSDSEWSKMFTVEEHERYYKYIGNGTLLLNSINASIKNSDFSIKKSKYLESSIIENQKLCLENDIWDKKAIERRTKSLAVDIIKYLNSLCNVYTDI
ncbi:DUF262 domain-containing protein [Catellicoccus marimammalium]|uniref:RloF n=1 Tax=Catellicoccus marimammalium M35/04/3 TaxID=1234409 RepID=K8Z8D1_9ENTE|nr:DUF262 domain-containing HNH endonuclease family protein [Catellicoccus marimammalium]EKU27304.1 RloF [Catellicoccus marimammalium M35/04/3]